MNHLGLYIHFPFCKKKCLYCDFLSFPIDQCLTYEKEVSSYMHCLENEIIHRSISFSNAQISSIFFGGGTPSLIPEPLLKSLMDCIQSHFNISPRAEITIESNPGTLTYQKLKNMKSIGINRLSIGLQSANDQELAILGRIHTWDTFLENYTLARDVGFNNINIDLMSALPSQTLQSYKETLDKVLSLKPEHISAYSLIIEEGTPFEKMEATLHLPDEDLDRQMYLLTDTKLRSMGYHRYEISNYAKEDFECRHNILYWTRGDYLGLGLGASSMIHNCRFSNTRSLFEYQKLWANPVDNDPSLQTDFIFPTNTIEDFEALSITAQIEEFIFLGLRLTKGINIEVFKKTFAKSIFDIYNDIIQKHISDKTLVYEHPYIRLTTKGLDVSNYIMSDFLT